MRLAIGIVAVILAYGLTGWAVWSINRRVHLSSELPAPMRWWIRLFVAIIVFLAVSWPLVVAAQFIATGHL